MQRSVLVAVFCAAVATSSAAQATEVCTYNVRYTLGTFCPVRSGQSVCMTETAVTGPCDKPLNCYGRGLFSCQAKLEPRRGPENVCPLGSVRPRALTCFPPIFIPGPPRTPTQLPFTPTFTPTATELAATATATLAPTVPATATATATATGVPTGTSTATVTATESAATPTATDVPSAPTGTATDTPPATATGTAIPTGTATATSTATSTATTVPAATSTNTAGPSSTATSTPLVTSTNTAVATNTATSPPSTNTAVATNTATALSTATRTGTAVATATNTALATNTATALSTATRTNTAVSTSTATVPAATSTNTPLSTNTATPLSTATRTNTAGPTSTNTTAPTNTPAAIGESVCTLTAGSELFLQTQALPLSLTPTGSFSIDCGAPGAGGTAACACELISFGAVVIPAIGDVCVNPAAGCEPGIVDCDGGSPIDVNLTADHDIGDCTTDTGCATACDAHCASLGAGFSRQSYGCEGQCQGGSNAGASCARDSECPGGQCPGGEPVGHAGTCNCVCAGDGLGDAARPGGLFCNLGTQINVELPSTGSCGDQNATIQLAPVCGGVTTETSTGVVNDANNSPGTTIPATGPESVDGTNLTCAALASHTITGLTMRGQLGFFDSTLGDIRTRNTFVCQ